MQYGMLIDRSTLLPRSIVPEPFVVGGAEDGRHSGVHYTMSLLAQRQHVYAFFGEGDSHTGVVILNRGALDELFRRYTL